MERTAVSGQRQVMSTTENVQAIFNELLVEKPNLEIILETLRSELGKETPVDSLMVALENALHEKVQALHAGLPGVKETLMRLDTVSAARINAVFVEHGFPVAIITVLNPAEKIVPILTRSSIQVTEFEVGTLEEVPIIQAEVDQAKAVLSVFRQTLAKGDQVALIALPFDTMFQRSELRSKEEFVNHFRTEYSKAIASELVNFEALDDHLKVIFIVPKGWEAIGRGITLAHGRARFQNDGIKADQFRVLTGYDGAADVFLTEKAVENITSLLASQYQSGGDIVFTHDTVRGLIAGAFSLLNEQVPDIMEGLSRTGEYEYQVRNELAFNVLLAFMNLVATEARAEIRRAQAA